MYSNVSPLPLAFVWRAVLCIFLANELLKEVAKEWKKKHQAVPECVGLLC